MVELVQHALLGLLAEPGGLIDGIFIRFDEVLGKGFQAVLGILPQRLLNIGLGQHLRERVELIARGIGELIGVRGRLAEQHEQPIHSRRIAERARLAEDLRLGGQFDHVEVLLGPAGIEGLEPFVFYDVRLRSGFPAILKRLPHRKVWAQRAQLVEREGVLANILRERAEIPLQVRGVASGKSPMGFLEIGDIRRRAIRLVLVHARRR